jgi:hypothetical protein
MWSRVGEYASAVPWVVIARERGRSSIPETSVIEPRNRSVLDTPQEPVIGLAEGETRWRGMTAVIFILQL